VTRQTFCLDGSAAGYRVDEFQPGDNFMLSLESDLQPVGAALLQYEWFGLQITHFAHA
jgi:hypothetical protein